MLLPPRKLDVYTFALMTGMFVGGNQLSAEYTGVSIIQRFGNRVSSMGAGLPPKAVEMQAKLKEEKERRRKLEASTSEKLFGEGKENGEKEGVLGELEKQEKGILKKVWMGNEGEDWKQKRDQREKEALEEGRGYGDLIMDQIWEVWSWGKAQNEEVKEIDEKVVAERKEKKAEEKK